MEVKVFGKAEQGMLALGMRNVNNAFNVPVKGFTKMVIASSMRCCKVDTGRQLSRNLRPFRSRLKPHPRGDVRYQKSHIQEQDNAIRVHLL